MYLDHTTFTFEGVAYQTRHGSPFDRGMADSYYGRQFDPHYYTGQSYTSQRIELPDPDAPAYKAYAAGYKYNEQCGDFKDWDDDEATYDSEADYEY
jgi:hypothetical protein